MVPGGRTDRRNGRTDGQTEWTDGHTHGRRQNYIPPTSSGDKNWFSRPTIPYAAQKVLQNAPREHSAILSTFMKLQFAFALSIFEWPLQTAFTVFKLP